MDSVVELVSEYIVIDSVDTVVSGYSLVLAGRISSFVVLPLKVAFPSASQLRRWSRSLQSGHARMRWC